MNNQLVVFISSIMNRQKDDLLEERNAAKEAIESINITKSWRFEDSPASSERVDLSYLNKVQESDIFLIILGQEITSPVEMEYTAAKGKNKPRLVFLKKTDGRTEELQKFVSNIIVEKYAEFENITDLKLQITSALSDELIRGYRNLGLSDEDKTKLEDLKTNIDSGGGDVVVGSGSIDKHVDRSIKIGGDAKQNVIIAGDGNTASLTISTGVNLKELIDLVHLLQNGIDTLDLIPKQQEIIKKDVAQLEDEMKTDNPDKNKVAGILDGIAGKLEMAGLVMKDIKQISEPVMKIAKSLGIVGMTIGGLIL